jgi:invasion protein IalB
VKTNNAREKIVSAIKKIFTFAVAAVALSSALRVALAEGAATSPAAAPQPTVSTKPFQDWLVRCPTSPKPLPCDAVQLLVEPKSKQRVLSISVAYDTTKSAHLVRMVLPLGVWLPNGVTIVAGQTKIEKVVVRRCEPFGCVVEGLLDGKLREAMRQGGEAKVVVFDQAKKPLDLKFSLKGYGEAEDYMVAETKKVKPPAVATPPAAPPG